MQYQNVLTIDKNTISGSSKAAIYVQPASTQYKVTVKNNTITGNKKVLVSQLSRQISK